MSVNRIAVPETPATVRSAGQPGRGSGRALFYRAAWGSLGLATLLLLWWLGTVAVTDEGSLARRFAPGRAFTSLIELLRGGELPLHILVSLKRIAIGLGVALAIGVPLGLALGSYRRLEASLSPTLQFLRMISPLSWMPIAVMVLGVGDKPVYFLLAFAAVWPILLNTATGVHQLDVKWVQLADSLAATRWEILRSVILPGVLGHILTGVRLAIGILWIVLVPAEMLGVSAGMGYFILDTRDRLAYSELMAMVLLIGALGFLLDCAARSLYRLWQGT